jgi:hypothetical protein
VFGSGFIVVVRFSSSYNAGPERQWRRKVPDETPSLEERERLLKERELKVKEQEIARKEKDIAASKWLNPVVLGLFAAAFAFAGNVIVTTFNNKNTTDIEHFRAQSTLILEAIKTNGDAKAVCKNLTFFVNLGLLDDPNKTIVGTCPKDSEGVPTLPADIGGGGSSTFSTAVTVIVKDDRGRPIQGATVRVTNFKLDSGLDGGGCKTLASGQCDLANSLPYGTLVNISAEKEGYAKAQTAALWVGVPITIVLLEQVNFHSLGR